MTSDGFQFAIESDSLDIALGGLLPKRSMMVLSAKMGEGKSVLTQRFTYGLLENEHKVVVATTESSTRGWFEQMKSLGYDVEPHADAGRLTVLSPFSMRHAPRPEVGIDDILEEKRVKESEIVVIDTASSLIGDVDTSGSHDTSDAEAAALIHRLRRFADNDHLLILACDPTEIDDRMMHRLSTSCEILLDLSADIIGGELKRTMLVRRFQRAAATIQSVIGWRVEPNMGFILDITAVA